MKFISQLNAAGLHLVDGTMRFQAALHAGSPVEATDGQGNNFRISAKGDRLEVEKLESSDMTSLHPVFVQSIGDNQPADGHVPARLVLSSSAQSNIFSFRAECQSDVLKFFSASDALGSDFQSTVNASEDGLPDVTVEIRTSATLEQLQDILRKIEDSHVMLQTLRQAPLEVNSLERNYDLH